MAALNGVKTLDMVGGEITKVAYNGAEYVRVDDAKIGDIAEIVDTWHRSLTEGEFYTVNYISDRDDFAGIEKGSMVRKYVGDIGRMKYFRKVSAETTPTIDERVDALEKRVDALEEKPAEPAPVFKEGDIVVVTGNSNEHEFEIGELVRIEEFDNSGEHRVEYLDGHDYWWVLESEMRHATQAERQAYEESLKPKLKAGDYVKFAEVNDYVTTEKHYEVFENPADGGYAYKHYVIDEDGKDNAIVLDNAYEIVEPTPFARAGRKEGEFKAGDIILLPYQKKRKYYEVKSVEGPRVNFYENSFGNETEFMPANECELIAPVESRVDGSERPCA